MLARSLPLWFYVNLEFHRRSSSNSHVSYILQDMAESFHRLSFSLMDQVKIFILVLLSINNVLGLRWQGPAGYYRRLLDLPSICPHISLASPWSAPSNLSLDTDLQLAEREKELLLLKIRNISLIVTGHISLISTYLKVWHVCCIQFIPICDIL